MVIAIAPIIIAIVGLLAYSLSTNAKVTELGRLAFFAGLLVLTFVLAHQTVHLP